MSHPEVLRRKHTRREFRERMQSGELKACIKKGAVLNIDTGRCTLGKGSVFAIDNQGSGSRRDS